jgi:hypothetical protein
MFPNNYFAPPYYSAQYWPADSGFVPPADTGTICGVVTVDPLAVGLLTTDSNIVGRVRIGVCRS